MANRKNIKKGLINGSRLDNEFKRLHRDLFADVYPWAGEVRDYSTGRGSAPFCLPDFIDSNMQRIFAALRAADGLRTLSPDQFAVRAAEVINEINAVHPFIEGNGRVSREFLKDLAQHAGHPIDLSRLTRATWCAAAARGFDNPGDNAPMRDCIRSAMIEPERAPARDRDRGRDDLV